MTNDSRRKPLGRGISALIPGAGSNQSSGMSSFIKKDNSEKVLMIPIEQIHRDAEQPREIFDEEELKILADSIKENGLIQPIIVRRDGDHYKIIAGERRWRATQIAGVKEIAAIVRDVSVEQSAFLALIENLHRSNLNPIEEAKGYQRLLEDFGKNHDEIAEKVGKDRSSVTNSLRLLSLPQKVQDFLSARQMSIGQAKVLLGLSDEKILLHAAEEVVSKGLTVRATEKLVSKLKKEPESGKYGSTKAKKSSSAALSPQIRLLTEQIQRALGTKAEIVEGKGGTGQIQIHYFSNGDLERILNLLIPERENN